MLIPSNNPEVFLAELVARRAMACSISHHIICSALSVDEVVYSVRKGTMRMAVSFTDDAAPLEHPIRSRTISMACKKGLRGVHVDDDEFGAELDIMIRDAGDRLLDLLRDDACRVALDAFNSIQREVDDTARYCFRIGDVHFTIRTDSITNGRPDAEINAFTCNIGQFVRYFMVISRNRSDRTDLDSYYGYAVDKFRKEALPGKPVSSTSHMVCLLTYDYWHDQQTRAQLCTNYDIEVLKFCHLAAKL